MEMFRFIVLIVQQGHEGINPNTLCFELIAFRLTIQQCDFSMTLDNKRHSQLHINKNVRDLLKYFIVVHHNEKSKNYNCHLRICNFLS